ncbi:MAG: hypothetical protein PUE84_06205 [Firmicutes bacterium]|nr:hypothetical protein [Bacillota bacterium]
MKKAGKIDFAGKNRNKKEECGRKTSSVFRKGKKVFFWKTKQGFWKTAGRKTKRNKGEIKGKEKNVRKISEDHGSGAAAGGEF